MDFGNPQEIVHNCLTWIGFGVVCGTAAKVLLPGRDPGGTFITLTLGGGGALIGASVYSWASGEHIGEMISPIGFAVAIGGALVLLISHRLLSGRITGERAVINEVIVPAPQLVRRRRTRTTRIPSDLE
jgi:uncharacterized membrane protein YeaQ/YmgE (transglycosylase-associated protein family)